MATLGELLQAKGDADYAGGGEGGAISPDLYSSAAANEYLQHAADLTYNAHRYLAEQHDRNLQEELKGLNDVDFKNLLPQDQSALMPEYSGVLHDTANNFGLFRNPLSNPDQFATLKANESGFRQKIAQAQSDAAFINKQNEFVQLHPEFNTPDFQQKKAAFLATPVGQRHPFIVAPPLTYNPATAYKTIAELAKKKYANSGTNGKYITQEEGEKIDPTQYAQLSQQLPGTDQYGNSLETARQNAYNNLPANIKSQYKDYGDFVNKEAQLYKPQDQVNKSEIKADEFGTIKAQGKETRRTIGMEEAFQGNQNELNRENALITSGYNKGKINPEQVADAKLRNMAVIENTGKISPDLAQSLFGDNNLIEKDAVVTSPKNKNEKITTKLKLPTTSFVSSFKDDQGNLHMFFKNNNTGIVNPSIVRTHEQLFNDLDGVFGDKYKPQVAGASSQYSQKTFGKPIPTVDDLRQHFGIGQPQAEPPLKSGSLDNL